MGQPEPLVLAKIIPATKDCVPQPSCLHPNGTTAGVSLLHLSFRAAALPFPRRGNPNLDAFQANEALTKRERTGETVQASVPQTIVGPCVPAYTVAAPGFICTKRKPFGTPKNCLARSNVFRGMRAHPRRPFGTELSDEYLIPRWRNLYARLSAISPEKSAQRQRQPFLGPRVSAKLMSASTVNGSAECQILVKGIA